MRRPTPFITGLLPVVFLLLTLSGMPLLAAPPDEMNREELKQEWKAARAATTADLKVAVVFKDKIPHKVVNIEFKTPAACETACKEYAETKNAVVHVVIRFEKFATVLVPASTDKELNTALDTLEKPNGIVWYEFVGKVLPPPPPAIGFDENPSGKAVPERIVRGGFEIVNGKKLTGKNTIVAIIDSGVDFRHPDFVSTTADGKKQSRFLAIWDTHREFVKGTGQPGPILYPGGVPVGTVFTREDLTADLEKKALGNFDVSSHGTACAGVAAGNGTALEQAKAEEKKKPNPNADLLKMDYRGVAPEADLIAVRIGNTLNSSLPNAWVLNAACNWIDTVAKKENKPVVISCSFGSEIGGRDGSRIAERWLSDRLPENRPGRLVFLAAGNQGSDGVHGAARCDPGNKGKLTWSLKEGEKAFIEIYVDDEKGGRLKKTDVKVEMDPKLGKVGNPYVNALSGSVIFPVSVTSGGSLSVTGDKSLVVDAYVDVETDPMTGEPMGKFTGLCVKNTHQLLSPATAPAAFAVGSYDFNHLFLLPKGLFETRGMDIGKLSDYSNAGYVRGKNSVKPEFAAPGQWHLAACPNPVPENVRKWNLLAMTEQYQRFNGTSAATPYAAGIAALLLEKNPKLTAMQLRSLLSKHLTKTKQTGDLPNPEWGYGKFDFVAVTKLLNSP